MTTLTIAVNNVLKAMKGLDQDAALRLYLGSVPELIAVATAQAVANASPEATPLDLAMDVNTLAAQIAPVERVMTEAGFPSSAADQLVVDTSAEVDPPAPEPATPKAEKEAAPPLKDGAK